MAFFFLDWYRLRLEEYHNSPVSINTDVYVSMLSRAQEEIEQYRIDLIEKFLEHTSVTLGGRK